MDYLRQTTKSLRALPIVLLLLVTGSGMAVAAENNTRVSISSEGFANNAAALSENEPSRDEYQSLTLSGDRNGTARAGSPEKAGRSESRTPNKAGSIESRTPNTDFWFYTVDVELFADQDRDGYYTGIDLLFDADTYYDIADVYAVIYLSFEYGPWNEYAETEDFTIFGSSATDEYIVETDLVEGYPTGNYDILIELYDTYDNALVATIGPEDTSELSILPLEDIGRDAPAGTTQVVVNSGGGGSLSWFLLLGLAAAVARKR